MGSQRMELIKAVEKNDFNTVKMMIENEIGDDWSAQSRSRAVSTKTAPGTAAENGYIEIMKLFLDYGLSPDVLDDALNKAISHNRTNIVEMILKNGIKDINVPDSTGQTFLMRAIYDDANPEIIELLLKYGGDIALKSNRMQKDTALDWYFTEKKHINKNTISTVMKHIGIDNIDSYLEYDKGLTLELRKNPKKMRIWTECEQKIKEIENMEKHFNCQKTDKNPQELEIIFRR